MKRKLITTKDGSHSIFVEELDEHYHSIHGALQESRHVFIEAGLKAVPQHLPEIHIFEMGLGTGLNAALTWAEVQNKDTVVHYSALEAFPVEASISTQLNYSTLIAQTGIDNFFKKIHESPWNEEVHFPEHFYLTKIQGKLETLELPRQFDLIYFDAFAPTKQPELWTVEIFEKMHRLLKPNGFLTTYCAKGSVKRALKAAGFSLEKLPGPPGKREMTRAFVGN